MEFYQVGDSPISKFQILLVYSLLNFRSDCGICNFSAKFLVARLKVCEMILTKIAEFFSLGRNL
jgi:hypothetical protein